MKIKEKTTLFLMAVFVFFSCNVQTKNIYDESDYILFKVDSSYGSIDKKTYVYKYDTTRKMVKNFYFNGSLMAKSFQYGKYLEGRLETYSYQGKLIGFDSFYHGKRIFEKVISPDTSVKIFNNGKLIPFTSLDSLH